MTSIHGAQGGGGATPRPGGSESHLPRGSGISPREPPHGLTALGEVTPQVGKSRSSASPLSPWKHKARAWPLALLPAPSGPYSPCSSLRLRGCRPSWTKPGRGWLRCVRSFRTARRAGRDFAGRSWRPSGPWEMRPVRRTCCSALMLSCGPPYAGLRRRRPGTSPWSLRGPKAHPGDKGCGMWDHLPISCRPDGGGVDSLS